MHKGVGIEGYNPVHAYRWRPLPVITAWSRTAALEPRVPPPEAIFYWFRAARPEHHAMVAFHVCLFVSPCACIAH